MVTTTKDNVAPQAICCPVKDIAPIDDELLASAAVFKALSDPTRLRILKAISHVDEACECNIVPEFGLTQPTISYHLRILRDGLRAGAGRDRRGVGPHSASRKRMVKRTLAPGAAPTRVRGEKRAVCMAVSAAAPKPAWGRAPPASRSSGRTTA